MTSRVGIIDYQMGNLRSVERGLQRAGGTALVSDQWRELQRASHLVLPGVGAFRDAMRALRDLDMIGFLRDWVEEDRPFLGICLGLQLLFDVSFEGGEHEGLGILPGKVVRFDCPSGSEWKVPHMGWNRVTNRLPEEPLMRGIPDHTYFYFVHSYYAVPHTSSDLWLESDYGHPFCAAVRRGNLAATQFHPEKSQGHGIQLLSNFLQLHPHLTPAGT